MNKTALIKIVFWVLAIFAILAVINGEDSVLSPTNNKISPDYLQNSDSLQD